MEFSDPIVASQVSRFLDDISRREFSLPKEKNTARLMQRYPKIPLLLLTLISLNLSPDARERAQKTAAKRNDTIVPIKCVPARKCVFIA